MRVELITMWYNEEDFAPFFLKHYSWVDKINLIIDADTNDKTVEIAKAYPNVSIEYFKFPDMMDDVLKTNKINSKYKEIDADWVIVVDSDEFIFDEFNDPDIRYFLNNIWNENVVKCKLFDVFKHIHEYPLDVHVSIPLQRRHGKLDNNYFKPSIVRGRLRDVEFSVGHHRVNLDSNDDVFLLGAHWAMVDYDIAVKRRIYGRKLRQSQFNLNHGFTFQHHHVTEEQIQKECEENNNLPMVF